jgi:Zn-dependent peptidase ImmA (M78 family)
VTYNPWLDAHQRYPEIHIEWHDIAPTRAAWVPSERIILVDESITKAERRCALAHELAHIDTGDLATELCWYGARQETGADKLAARRLIDAHDLAAVARWTQDSREIAEALEVTLGVLALRHTYMAPWERGVVWRAVSGRVAVA